MPFLFQNAHSGVQKSRLQLMHNACPSNPLHQITRGESSDGAGGEKVLDQLSF